MTIENTLVVVLVITNTIIWSWVTIGLVGINL